MKVDFLNDITPLPGAGGYGTVLRTLRTPFVEKWSANREEARQSRESLLADIVASARAGQFYETLPPTGQTAGGIKEILPVADIMRQLVAETEAALSSKTTK